MAVQTVTGPIDASELGFTYMHEHIVMNDPALYTNFPHTRNRAPVLAQAIERLREAHELGVRTIVDLTPSDYLRDPELVRDASIASGVQIVHATGGYWLTSPYYRNAPVERMVELFRYDIEVGMNGTDIRAGILKCATDFRGVTKSNERLLRAVARTHRETGVPISTHTNMGQHTGLEQQRVFLDEGLDLGRVVIGHSNDTYDVPYLEQVIEAGSYIGMDRFGVDRLLDEDGRIGLLVEMCERGYAERIVISHDAGVEFNFGAGTMEQMPNWNWRTIPTRILPEAKRRGVTDEQIAHMTVENPRRVFAQDRPY